MNRLLSRPTRRQWLRMAAAAAAAGAAWPLRAEPTVGFGAQDLDWTDPARQRAVPVRLYLPHGARQVPLLVFSHGIGGSRRGYRWLGEHIASQGMASLHVQHVGSDRQLWSGNVFGIVGRLQAAAQDREAVARVQDLRFALDHLLAGDLAPHIDPGRIVAAGHSYGANTTLLACGARVQREGRSIELRDERLRAAIVISAPPFYGEADPAQILHGVNVPSLHVTATEDVIRIPGYYSGLEDRLTVFEATASLRKWLAVFEGGSHSMFTDRSGTGGAALNPQVKEATRGLVSAFLRQVFDGDGRDIAAWPARHGRILARFEEAGT